LVLSSPERIMVVLFEFEKWMALRKVEERVMW
jgi:hypothetical protein